MSDDNKTSEKNNDDTSSPEPGYMNATRMSFGDHLEELRTCLIRALLGAGVCSILGFVFSKQIMVVIFRPLFSAQRNNDLRAQLQALSPQAAFVVYLKVAFLSGLILATPWIIWQVWRFVSSGLYPREQRFAKRFAPISVGLFALGVLFLYFVVLPIVLNFFITFNKSFGQMAALNPLPQGNATTIINSDHPKDVNGETTVKATIPVLKHDPAEAKDGQTWIDEQTGQWVVMLGGRKRIVAVELGSNQASITSHFSIDFYVSFVLMLALAFGLAFELPIVVFFLAVTGIVSTAEMARGRRYVILATFILAAVMTPPDVISQLLLALPMLLLFEVGLIVARSAEKK